MTTNLDYKLDYRRDLPHIQPEGATLFITMRLYGSLPESALQRLKDERDERKRIIEQSVATDEVKQALLYDEEKRHFGRYDRLLDRVTDGQMWLRDPKVATVVCEAIHYRDGSMYDLEAYCVMPNHAHLVFTPLLTPDGGYYALSKIMQGLKGFSAYQANDLLDRKGTFWQHESFDHYVRNPGELSRIVQYVLNNPVNAGLVDSWEEWPWTYWKYIPDRSR
jgi:REP element-mobilizing transposase RayT